MSANPQSHEKDVPEPPAMSFWAHLEELRGRLIKAVLFILAGFVIASFFVSRIQDFLVASFFPKEVAPLAYLKPTEGFVVSLKLALVCGLILGAPGILYQFWRFVAPGLYPREKRFIVPVVLTSTLCFLAGIVFSFFVLPYATNFFLSFGAGKIQNVWSFGSYITFITQLMLAFGVVFELPLVIYFLVRLGVVAPETLRKQRRYAIIIILVIAAIITPPDVFTMTMISVPMIVLYEVSLLLASWTVKKRELTDKNV
jgi:sec-independent protein translocase protein TatC